MTRLAVPLAIALALLALIAAFLVGRGLQVATGPSPSVTVTPTPAVTLSPTATPQTTPSPATGAISGRLGYPSEFVPPLTVYAISVNDPNVWFATSTPTLGNAKVSPSPGASPSPTWPASGPGTYTIRGISPGQYVVIAYRDDTNFVGLARGGYTTAGVKCLGADPAAPTPAPGPCPSANDHTLIPVTVGAGQAVMNIGIVDWFLQGSTYPARPTPRP